MSAKYIIRLRRINRELKEAVKEDRGEALTSSHAEAASDDYSEGRTS